MEESELNTIIKNTIYFKGWAYKIPDDSSIAKPHDGYGVLNRKPIYWEAKVVKASKNISFKIMEDQQVSSLVQIDTLLGNKAYCVVPILYNIDGKNRLYLFHIKFALRCLITNKTIDPSPYPYTIITGSGSNKKIKDFCKKQLIITEEIENAEL